jgi:hypothetical protein
MVRTDPLNRLLSNPGKIEIICPTRTKGRLSCCSSSQSNAGNHQGQRHQSADDRVVNFVDGRCYRAASPLLGADGQDRESWTLLGNKLVQSGLYRTVILIPATVGGSSIRLALAWRLYVVVNSNGQSLAWRGSIFQVSCLCIANALGRRPS